MLKRSFVIPNEKWLAWAHLARDQGDASRVNFAGTCQAPRVFTAITRREVDGLHVDSHHLDAAFRCRRCDPCLRHKARVWAIRAKAETELWRATWFVTLTLGPQARLKAAAAAEWAGSWEALHSPDKWERVGALAPWVRKELQRFLYRLRRPTKARPWAGPGWRYLAAIEPHRDGTPHVHLLLHDLHARLSDDERETRRLKEIWPHGFLDRAPVPEGAEWYVAKYISKAPRGHRTMASRSYGRPAKPSVHRGAPPPKVSPKG